MDVNKDQFDINDLVALMQKLRDPVNGCPWDLQQNFQSIKPHTIEEAYEVADAIEHNNMVSLKDELGDLLFQVIFHAQMAAEKGHFDLLDVIDHVTRKMIFRHPHVFTDQKATDAKDVEDNVWEQQKAKEKQDLSGKRTLDHVTMALPSLLLANKMQKQVRKYGFEYTSINDVFDKLDEEVTELRQAMNGTKQSDIIDEYGDVLFVSALIGSYLKLNAEETLRKACLKFKERFNTMEDDLSRHCGLTLSEATIEDMMAAWIRAKKTVCNQKS